MRKQRFIRGPELLDSGRVDTYKGHDTYKGQYPEVLVGIVHVVEVV